MSTAVAVTSLPPEAARRPLSYVRATLVGAAADGEPTLHAGGDNKLDFGHTVHHLIVQNHTRAPFWLDYQAPATRGSIKVQPSETTFIGLQLRHLYLCVEHAGALLNGTEDGGILVWGAPLEPEGGQTP